MGQLCSIYRLAVDRLDEALKPAFDGQRHDIVVADRPAIRVDRGSDDKPPDWAAGLEQMTGRTFEFLTRAAGAVLLIDLGDVRYALAFGTGRHLLRDTAIQSDFGIAVAIRCLDPERVAEVTRTALDLTDRHDITQLPTGAHVREFGVEQYAEIVKEIGGRSRTLQIAYLQGRPEGVKLEGRDALRVRVSAIPAVLIGDLIAVEKAYQQEPHAELAFIEGLRPIKTNNAQLGRAQRALVTELAKPDSDRLGIAHPLGIDDIGVEGFTIDIYGRQVAALEPGLEPVRRALNAVPPAQQIEALQDGRVNLIVADTADPTETPLGAWLSADLTVGGDHYVYHDGAFYLMTNRYRDTLNAAVDDLLAAGRGLQMPAWRPGTREDDYCRSQPAFVCLDKKLVRGGAHPRGIEICDLVGPGGELICVKRAAKSSALSHLFFQAIVAAEDLCDGDHAYRRLLTWLPPERRPLVPRRPNFVFGIQLAKGELTANSLFTFSKVGLFRATRHLHRLHMPVSVVEIPAA
jgi:uncharacterized protein (TIGR04141 family)